MVEDDDCSTVADRRMRRDDEADDDAYAIDDGETKRREVLKAVVVVAEIGAVLHAWQFVLASASRERTAAEVDIFMVMVVVGRLCRRLPYAGRQMASSSSSCALRTARARR